MYAKLCIESHERNLQGFVHRSTLRSTARGSSGRAAAHILDERPRLLERGEVAATREGRVPPQRVALLAPAQHAAVDS